MEQHPKNEAASDMFSKLHHQQQQHHHQSPHPPQHIFPHNPFQLAHTAAVDDGGASQKPNSSGDGSSIEVVRRPRGRPPGSKNRPKPPLIITRDPEPAMSPYILEVAGGNDVVQAIALFSRRKNMGLSILTGSGTVANVTLRQPSTTPGATVTFHGRFDILSINATFLPQQQPALSGGFSISLAGPQGQIVGGIVAGGLMAAGTVFVVAASFNSPSYHRLPPPEEEAGNSASAGDVQSPPVSGGGDDQAASCGMSMYSCQLASDVIWAPTARPPPPPY